MTESPIELRNSAANTTGSNRWVTGGVVGIVVATFFSGVGHEMATAALPMYLTPRARKSGLFAGPRRAKGGTLRTHPRLKPCEVNLLAEERPWAVLSPQ
jgi:hypothetical protein